MATEILVNDGGAPSRILPFTAGAALSGGHVLTIESDGYVDPAPTTAATNTIGVAFVDASSGSNCSVITGKGVVVNCYITGTVAKGGLCQVDAADGILVAGTTADAGVAVSLDGHSGAATLGKVLLI